MQNRTLLISFATVALAAVLAIALPASQADSQQPGPTVTRDWAQTGVDAAVVWPRGLDFSIPNGPLRTATRSGWREIPLEREATAPSLTNEWSEDLATTSDIDRFDQSNLILVLETQPDNSRIVAWDAEDLVVHDTWSGTGNGVLSGPCGIDISRHSEVYVTDFERDQLFVFDLEGTHLRTIGAPGIGFGQSDPGLLDLDCGGNNVVFHREFVYVGDSDRIQVFQADGTFVRTWGRGGVNGSTMQPAGVAVAQDKLWVADAQSDRVLVFEFDGTLVEVIPTPTKPLGLAVDPSGKTLWYSHGHPFQEVVTMTVFRCEGQVPTHVGTSLLDIFSFTLDNDVIVHAGADGDVIDTGAGDDLVCGGGGDDRIFLGDGKDRARGQEGNDEIDGGPGNDNINGNNGNDTIFGRDGHDYLAGRDGEDTIDGGPGTDTINGGGRSDDLVGGTGNDTMNGNGFGDLLIGDAGNDTMNGGDGNDDVIGSSGTDLLLGGRGNDSLQGGDGFDTCDGKTGTDTAATCEIERNVP